MSAPATLGLDVSNWTDRFGLAQVGDWRRSGYDVLIPQAVNPAPPYPPGRTAEQVQAGLDGGMLVPAYVWGWFGIADPIGDIRRKLDLLAPFGRGIRRIWLDVEDNTVPAPDQGGSAQRYVDLTHQMLDVCGEFGAFLPEPGLYSGSWYWLRWMLNTWEFNASPLWPAEYNGNADPDAFSWFGGWANAAIHQHIGTSTVGGVGNVDQSGVSASELQLMQGEAPAPQLNPLVVPFADLADRVVTDPLSAELARRTRTGRLAAINRKVVQSVVDETIAARTAALGPRPEHVLRLVSNLIQAQDQFQQRADRRWEYRQAA